MDAVKQSRAGGWKRRIVAAASVVSMLALHGCVYVGGCGSWGGGGGWHGGSHGGWHGGGRCDVRQLESTDGVRLCEGWQGNQRLDSMVQRT